MVVTCPQCSKRYMLDDALLPKEGRQVRCVACHHVWRQIPEVDLHMHVPPPLEATGPINAVASRRYAGVGWISFFVLILLCMGTLIFGRNMIVSYWPMGEIYYEIAGLPINLPGAGLTITNASSESYHEGEAAMIRVKGSLTNTTDTVRQIPPLKIKLLGGENHELDQWEHALSAQSLLPGEKIDFETDPRPRVEGTQQVRVEF